MPEETVAQDNYIPALDDDGGQPTEVSQEAEEQQSQQAQAEETQTPPADAPADDALLEQYAKRTGLDPNDPGQRKTLDTIVAKEKFIQELQAKLNTQQAAAGSQEPKPALTPFEQQLEEQAKAQAAQQPQEQGVQQPETAGVYNDAGANWRDAVDAYTALAQAWSNAAEQGDYRNVIAVEAALWERRFDAIGAPKVQQLVDQYISQRLGDVVPAMRETLAQRESASSAEFAFAELEKTQGYEGIRELDREEPDGPPIVFNGEQFRNTPLNRVIAENPWIMHIKRDNADPKVADRLTYLARLKAAHRIFQSEGITAQKAKSLVDAGSKIEQRKSQDRVRQSLNSGRGANGSLDQSRAKPKGYIEELLHADDGPVSFADL